jgi:deoxyadenosine/deoxycytidine kinase
MNEVEQKMKTKKDPVFERYKWTEPMSLETFENITESRNTIPRLVNNSLKSALAEQASLDEKKYEKKLEQEKAKAIAEMIGCNCGKPKLVVCIDGEIIEAIKRTQKQQTLKEVEALIDREIKSWYYEWFKEPIPTLRRIKMQLKELDLSKESSTKEKEIKK